ncbi:hypothetical protein [Chryseobacterium wanjuense]
MIRNSCIPSRLHTVRERENSQVQGLLPTLFCLQKASSGALLSEFQVLIFHYDYDLAYRKASLYSNISFRKNPRSTVSRGVALSYNYFERDLSPERIAKNDYDKYNLWSLGYGYSDSQSIHEKSLSVSTQWMEDFNKITAEGFYRWEFAPRQKLSVRLFAGYFVKK